MKSIGLSVLALLPCLLNGLVSPPSRVHPPAPPRTAGRGRAVVSRPWRQAGAARVQAGMTTFAIQQATTSSSTFLVRIVFLRAMAFVYAVAFLVALRQNKALIGDDGITPARVILDRAQERGAIKRERRLSWMNHPSSNNEPVVEHKFRFFILLVSRLQRSIGRFVDRHDRLVRLREVLWDRSDRLDRPVTTMLWLAKDRNKLNKWLDGIALMGWTLAILVLWSGAANVPILLTLWSCQRSLMAVGGPWYNYGWEPQLAEVGFHALFLVPLWSVHPLPSMPVPELVRWTLQWHLFRVMMGAGLIKFRAGDVKWKDRTAMQYFYETQPVPNPLSRYFHWAPRWYHQAEVIVNYIVELVAPWILIMPCLTPAWRRAGGLVQIGFQAAIILSGNLGFLNWLTMTAAIPCLDDALVGNMFFSAVWQEAAAFRASAAYAPSRAHQAVILLFFTMIITLSIPVIRNLFSARQVMNTSFDPLRLINSYGAFGTVQEERTEWIVSSACRYDGPWKEYEFQVKPGPLYRSPRFISPYHHRLDWQMWIAACTRSDHRNPWVYRFLLKLLQQDPKVLRLLAKDPWSRTTEMMMRGQDEHASGAIDDDESSSKPKYIRIELYRYSFHRRQPGERNPPVWDRKLMGKIFPRQGLVTVASLEAEIERLQNESAWALQPQAS